jgi:hypothetical protein
MAIQTIEILRNYMTCEDPAVKNKYWNLLESFYHKSEGKILASIEETQTEITLNFTDGNSLTSNESVTLAKLPEAVAISYVTGLQDALNNKVDKVPGKGLSDENFSLIEKQKLASLINYVKPNSENISYINGLQEALDNKVDAVEGLGLPSNDFTNALKQKLDGLPQRAEMIIDSGGNYNNLELTGNILHFTNTNAQAIITGFDSSVYKTIYIVNKSDFVNQVNRLDSNSSPANQVDTPSDMAVIGIEGAARFDYIDSIQKWQLTTLFATKLMPEHRAIQEAGVVVVNPGGASETKEMIELETFRDAQATVMTKAELNTAYPNAVKGFEVICNQINIIYKKTESIGEWKPITMGNNVV